MSDIAAEHLAARDGRCDQIQHYMEAAEPQLATAP